MNWKKRILIRELFFIKFYCEFTKLKGGNLRIFEFFELFECQKFKTIILKNFKISKIV